MRLTKYEPSENSMFPYKSRDKELSTELDIIHKLGQLEDLEEELKVGLDKIAKALLHGAYFVHMKANFHTEIVYSNRVKVDQGFIYYFLMKPKPSKDSDNYSWLYCWLNNYGKTWALTKEELL